MAESPRAEGLRDPIAIGQDVARILTALEVPYLVAGSLGSSIHGEPRATLDVDIVVDLKSAQLPALVRALNPAYYVDEAAAGGAVATGSSFNAVHVASSIKVDFFVVGTDAFDQERLRQRLTIPIGLGPDSTLVVDRPEFLLLRKLEWFRRGGEVSERQWRDVLAIVAVQGPRLDRDLLAQWATRLGVADLLRRVVNAD